MTQNEIDNHKNGGLLIHSLQEKIASQERYIQDLEKKLAAMSSQTSHQHGPTKDAAQPHMFRLGDKVIVDKESSKFNGMVGTILRIYYCEPGHGYDMISVILDGHTYVTSFTQNHLKPLAS